MKRQFILKKIILLTPVICILYANPLIAQHQDLKYAWQKDKPGQWIYKYNIHEESPEEALFEKNVSELAGWFHQNIPLLNKPTGFNVDVYVSRGWDEHYRLSSSGFGLTADIQVRFHLFDQQGMIWKAELPSASYYSFTVNRLAGSGSWVGTIGQFDYFNNTRHDPKLEGAINRAASALDEMMTVFPLKRELSPGVHLYENQAGENHIVVFDPGRPAYLIPVTLRELADAYLNYYSLFQTLEIDRMLLDELKNEIAAFSEQELNSPAYAGHPSNIVLRFSADKHNLPVMRLNPGYWDKSLSPSAIQLMVFYYPQMSEEEMVNHLERFGYPVNSQIMVNQINWSKVAGLVRIEK